MANHSRSCHPTSNEAVVDHSTLRGEWVICPRVRALAEEVHQKDLCYIVSFLHPSVQGPGVALASRTASSTFREDGSARCRRVCDMEVEELAARINSQSQAISC